MLKGIRNQTSNKNINFKFLFPTKIITITEEYLHRTFGPKTKIKSILKRIAHR